MSVGFISSGSAAVDAVLSYFQGERTEYLKLQELNREGKKEELLGACRSHLDQLAGKAVRCGAVIFSNGRIQNKWTDGDSVKQLPIQIIHKSQKPLTDSNQLDVSPPDEGIVDFYLLDWPNKSVLHVKLDPASDMQLEISANPHNLLDVDRRILDSVKDRPWNGCVVVPEMGCFNPHSFTPLSPSQSDVSDVKG